MVQVQTGRALRVVSLGQHVGEVLGQALAEGLELADASVPDVGAVREVAELGLALVLEHSRQIRKLGVPGCRADQSSKSATPLPLLSTS